MRITRRPRLDRLGSLPLPLCPRELRAWRRGPRALANSIPKAGTHLLARLLAELPLLVPRWQDHLDANTPGLEARIRLMRRGQWFTAHLPWNESLVRVAAAAEVRMLFLYRDLRDVAVSNAFYIAKAQSTHRLSGYFRSLPSDSARLLASIGGVDGALLADGVRSRSIGEHAADFLPWLDEANCLPIRFEDLIGPAGGGSRERQVEVVRRVLAHLSVAPSEDAAMALARRTFDPTVATFRKGQIGDWRNHFGDEHKRLFKSVAGEALIRLGYERDSSW